MANPIDRIVEYLDPAAAVRRKFARSALRITNSGYGESAASVRKTSTKWWTATSGNARADIEIHLPLMRQRSRDLCMTGGIARAALGRLQTNVIGTGLRLRSMPDAEVLGISREDACKWGRQVEREWSLWADSKDCDALGLNTFDEIQLIAILSWMMSGDIVALLPIRPLPWANCDLRIQLVEADRVSSPEKMVANEQYHDGVETDLNGRVIAYHICNQQPMGLSYGKNSTRTWQRIEARGGESGRWNVLHLMVAERPDQYRGVPILAPVMVAVKQISRYAEAELMAAVISAMYTVFIKSTSPQNPLGEMFVDEQYVAADPTATPAVEERLSPQDSSNELGLGNGAVIALNPDEDISIANPGRPNAAFDGFVKAMSREIGASINVPAELLLLEFTSSYSASRAALLEAWKGFRMWRKWMAVDFCQPVYLEWLTESVLSGRVSAAGFLDDPAIAAAWAGTEWNGPAAGQIDPMKEVQAAQLRVEQGFSTRTRETAEINGGDYESNLDGLADEQSRRGELGISVGTPAAAGIGPDGQGMDGNGPDGQDPGSGGGQ
jgi:lambda family phage portal protein